MSAGGFRRSSRLRSSGFAQIPNDVLRDRALSGRARGVLGYLLSHSAGFNVTRSRLQSDFPEGRDALDTALRELREAGYIRSVREQGEDGRYVGGGYLVFDERGAADVEEPEPEESTDRENRTTGNPRAYKNTIPKNTKVQEHQEISLDSVYEKFRAAWKLVGVWQAGPKVRAKLGSLLKAGKLDLVFEGLDRLAADPNRPEAQFVPRPLTWLNGERWADDPYPPRQGGSAAAGRVMGIDVGEIPVAAAKPAEIAGSVRGEDDSARSNPCPTCNARAGEHCSYDGEMERVPIWWEHDARIDERKGR